MFLPNAAVFAEKDWCVGTGARVPRGAPETQRRPHHAAATAGGAWLLKQDEILEKNLVPDAKKAPPDPSDTTFPSKRSPAVLFTCPGRRDRARHGAAVACSRRVSRNMELELRVGFVG